MPEPVYVSEHPIVRHMLASLRDVNTLPPRFRELVSEIAQALFYEATRDLRIQKGFVTTPMAECPAERIADTIGLLQCYGQGSAWPMPCSMHSPQPRFGTSDFTAITRL